eukprot:TRINITY_DN28585_c0_g1_i1.p1 TRINITY_DN28585_c0_g1~~TRINITY_DN28585_c0_g1_i1.p1  ORF type:complete len:527 (+),score=175.77 TRINITY_DN28585_c0_g1_i1:99-1679(+)
MRGALGGACTPLHLESSSIGVAAGEEFLGCRASISRGSLLRAVDHGAAVAADPAGGGWHEDARRRRSSSFLINWNFKAKRNEAALRESREEVQKEVQEAKIATMKKDRSDEQPPPAAGDALSGAADKALGSVFGGKKKSDEPAMVPKTATRTEAAEKRVEIAKDKAKAVEKMQEAHAEQKTEEAKKELRQQREMYAAESEEAREEFHKADPEAGSETLSTSRKQVADGQKKLAKAEDKLQKAEEAPGGGIFAAAVKIAKKGVEKVKKTVGKLSEKLGSLVSKEAEDDAFPARPLVPPPDVPLFPVFGKGASSANVAQAVASRRAAEASAMAATAARAADAAAAQAAMAEAAYGDALAAHRGAVNESYVQSISLTLNRLSKLVAQSAESPLKMSASVPQEFHDAEDMAQQSRTMLSESEEIHERMEELLKDNSLDDGVLRKLRRAEDQHKDLLASLGDVDKRLQRNREFMMSMRRPPFEGDPPELPQQLLRPDGTPWWPEPPPPVKLPPRMIMLKPQPGVKLDPAFL